MKHIRFSIALVVLMLAVLACGLPAGGNDVAPQNGTSPANSGQVESPVDAQTEITGEPFLSIPGIGHISLLTNVQGGGAMPLFAWEPVSDTARYQLVVFDEVGEPYWAWEGVQTQVYMGGSDSQPDEDSSGPSVGADYTWAVVAYDDAGKILAASDIQPISP